MALSCAFEKKCVILDLQVGAHAVPSLGFCQTSGDVEHGVSGLKEAASPTIFPPAALK
jgi:hypothetical protein